MLVDCNKMTGASVSDMCIDLECSRIAVGHIINMPLPYGGYIDVGGDENKGDEHANTNVEHRVFSWAGQPLSPPLSPAMSVGRKIVSPSAGSPWRSGIHVLPFLVYLNIG